MAMAVLLLAIAGATPAAAAEPTGSFAYQGRLEYGGQAQSGTFQFAFRLFGSATANPATDTPLWQSGTLDLPVVAGSFSTLLGPMPLTILRAPALYLAVSVKGPSDTALVQLGGLQQIVAVPQATVAWSGVPAGTIVAYAGTAAPAGWLLCNGAEVSRLDYPDLGAAIGETYGQGSDGAGGTFFLLPALGGRVPIGAGSIIDPTTSANFNFALGAASGTVNHRLTVAEMPAHSHSYQHYFDDTSPNGAWATPTGDETGAGHSDPTESVGGGQAHNNLQPYLVVNYLIKY
jgi:microcystin-dependent protein